MSDKPMVLVSDEEIQQSARKRATAFDSYFNGAKWVRDHHYEPALASLRAENERLRAMVPKWMLFTEWEQNRNSYRGWDMIVHNLDQRKDPARMVLLCPPIPLPAPREREENEP